MFCRVYAACHVHWQAETRQVASQRWMGCSGEKAANLKWAASQEAVTLPWLSAHSIRTRIGGNASIVDPPSRLSRSNSIGFEECPNTRQICCNSGKSRGKPSVNIDTPIARMLL